MPTKLMQKLRPEVDPHHNAAVDYPDLAEAFNKAYEATEAIDRISSALRNDNTTPIGDMLHDRVEDVAFRCKSLLDTIVVEMSEIEQPAEEEVILMGVG